MPYMSERGRKLVWSAIGVSGSAIDGGFGAYCLTPHFKSRGLPLLISLLPICTHDREPDASSYFTR